MSWPCRGEMMKRLLIVLVPKLNASGIRCNCCRTMFTITKTNFGQISFKTTITSVGF